MSYENPSTVTIPLGSVNFATGSTSSFRLPKGKEGRLIDVSITATTVFTNVTTGAFINIGTIALPAANASLGSLGTLAVGQTFNTFSKPTAITNAALAADTQYNVSYVASTGATPTGAGLVYAVVEIF